MARKTLGTKVEEDTELYEQFEDYRERNAITNSEALRLLMRSGLEAENEQRQESEEREQSVGDFFDYYSVEIGIAGFALTSYFTTIETALLAVGGAYLVALVVVFARRTGVGERAGTEAQPIAVERAESE